MDVYPRLLNRRVFRANRLQHLDLISIARKSTMTGLAGYIIVQMECAG
jgi:hypothetical protein